MVETVDIFPTLCELTEIEKPKFAIGTSFNPMLKKPSASGQPADDGGIELYDEKVANKEVVNIADSNPKIVKELKAKLDGRFKSKK